MAKQLHAQSHIIKYNTNCQNGVCIAHHNWTLEQWKPVLWGDESRFSVWLSDGILFSIKILQHLVESIPGEDNLFKWGTKSILMSNLVLLKSLLV